MRDAPKITVETRRLCKHHSSDRLVRLRPAPSATFAKARKALLSEVEQALVALSAQLPQMVVDSLREQVARIKALSEDILVLEKRLGQQLRQDIGFREVALNEMDTLHGLHGQEVDSQNGAVQIACGSA